jgi:signal peptide peptidase SppA
MSKLNSKREIIIAARNSIFTIGNLFKLVFAIIVIMGIASAINNKTGNNYIKFNTSYEVYNKYFEEMKINKEEKLKEKDNVKAYSKTMFLIDFVGSVSGEEVEKLRRDVDFILINSKQGDEVAVKLYSPGGAVTSYGLAASELKRIKDAGLPLTVLIDEVAASGGYMMAVVSDKIIAAPFAYVGSIGVVAQVPIYEDLLKNFGVEYKVYTAGENKRNVVSQIKPSMADEEKLKNQISKIHSQFKLHVKKYRNFINIEEVATGDVFSGDEALALKLIDEISTSSNYLLDKHNKNTRIIYVFTEEAESKNVGFINTFAEQFINTLTDKLVKEVKSQFYSNYENIRV